MCWVISTPGASAGSCMSRARVASVPPVDAPMKMSFSVERQPSAATLFTAVSPVPAALARRTWARAAVRSLLVMSCSSRRKPSATPMRGLATKSTAPSSSARNVTSAPRSVKVETITTGMGRSRISLPRKSMPSMRGISTSSVMTSGLSARIISRATSGSLAAPMQHMSLWRLMISASRLRTSAESSTTRTRVFMTALTERRCRPSH